MSILKKNIIANFGGKAWAGLIQLLFVPFYIKFLGMEAFGLIGFFIMLQGLLGLLDLGLSTTLNRELACRSANNNAHEVKDLVRTMEWIYWPIAIVIAVGIIVVAPWIARSWVNVKELPLKCSACGCLDGVGYGCAMAFLSLFRWLDGFAKTSTA